MNSEFIGICRELESWYEGERGDYLQKSLQQALNPVLGTAFGYHLVQAGLTSAPVLFNSSTIHHCVMVSPQQHCRVGLVSELEAIPLESESVDVLIAHHALEFATNSHQVLREMQRVLAPQGHLIIIGFDPHSPMGLAHWLKGKVGHPLWRNRHTLSRSRIVDWLHLLGCELQDRQHLFAVPLVSGRLQGLSLSINKQVTRNKWPLGGIYMLHAIKQVQGLIQPRRMRERRVSQPLLGLVPEPGAARQPSRSVVPITSKPS